MISYKITVDLSKAPNAEKMENQANDVVDAALTECGLIFQNTVMQNTPQGASKLLRGSIFSEPRGNPVREVIVSSPQLYAPIVERGRKPGKAPIITELVPGKRKPQVKRWRAPALELWVQRVLGIGGERGQQVAVAIAIKIGAKGTTGAAMFFKGFNQGRAAAERVLGTIGATIVAEWEK